MAKSHYLEIYSQFMLDSENCPSLFLNTKQHSGDLKYCQSLTSCLCLSFLHLLLFHTFQAEKKSCLNSRNAPVLLCPHVIFKL